LTFSAPPQRPQGAGHLKFTIYTPLVPKIHHTKFEENWSSGYQVVKMLTDTMHNDLPRPGGKIYTPRIMKFTILVEAFLLYITMHLDFFFYMHAVLEKKIFFLKNGQFSHFLPCTKGPRGQET
jgi:hypothetical protein